VSGCRWFGSGQPSNRFQQADYRFRVDGNKRVEELVGDVSKDGGATRGDTILDDEDQELGKELVDLLGGLQVVELTEEVGGKVDINRLCGLELQRSMAKTKSRADGHGGGTDVQRW